MKLSRMKIRRLIESVINEESKSHLNQNSEIRAAVVTRLNKHDKDSIEFGYDQVKSKEDSKGQHYVYVNNKSSTGKKLVDKILDCLAANDARAEEKSESVFTVNNFAGMNGLKFKFFGKQLTVTIPAKKWKLQEESCVDL